MERFSAMKLLLLFLALFQQHQVGRATGNFIHSNLSRNGTCVAATSACTFTATATGSLKIVFAYRSGSTTAPSLPSSGWTQIATGATGNGGTTGSFRIGCNVSSGTGDTGSGTWTNAGGVVGISYAGTAATTTANCVTAGTGGKATTNAKTSTSASFLTITMTVSNGKSWVDGFLGDSASSTCAPAGMGSRAATGLMLAADTGGGVTAWPTTNCTVSSSTWMSYVVEVLSS